MFPSRLARSITRSFLMRSLRGERRSEELQRNSLRFSEVLVEPARPLWSEDHSGLAGSIRTTMVRGPKILTRGNVPLSHRETLPRRSSCTETGVGVVPIACNQHRSAGWIGRQVILWWGVMGGLERPHQRSFPTAVIMTMVGGGCQARCVCDDRGLKQPLPPPRGRLSL